MKKLFLSIMLFALLAPLSVFAELGQTPETYSNPPDSSVTQTPRSQCASLRQGFDPTANGGQGGCTSIRTPANDSNPPGFSVTPNGNIKYVPLEPIPGLVQTGNSNFGELLSSIFKLLIMIGGFIAIGGFVYAGIEYMTSNVVGSKANAKKRLQATLLGLFLLIASWLILNTINPQLVNLTGGLNPAPNYTYNPGVPSVQPSTQQKNAQDVQQALQNQRPVDPAKIADFQAERKAAMAQCVTDNGRITTPTQCASLRLQTNQATGVRYNSCTPVATGLTCAK